MNYKLLFVGVLFLFLIGSVHASLTDDLVSYYKLDGTTGVVVDELGTNDGTNYGATRGVTGIINNAFEFDGTNDYVISDFDLDDYPFSFSGWFYIPEGSSGGVVMTISDITAPNRHVYISASEINETITLLVRMDPSGSEEYAYIIKDIESINLVEKWIHVTGVWVSSSERYLYVNGEIVTGGDDTKQTNSFNTNINKFVLGRRYTSYGTQNYFDGKIDEVGIWSRALTSNEITTLYNSGSGLTYPFTEVNANFDFSLNYETATATLTDTSTTTDAVEITNWLWTIDGNTLSTDQNTSFVFTANTDYNIGLFVDTNVPDLNSQIYKTISIPGTANFTFYDEDTEALLNDVVYTISPSINGVSGGTLTDTNTLDLNLQGITSQEYTFTFSKENYGTRTYQTNLNQYSDIDLNFALLPNTIGIPLTFQIRQPTTKTLVTNTLITITKENYTISQTKTNSSGFMTINLNPDQNQARYTLSFTFDGTNYDWNGTTVTIETPRKETSPATTITPYEITINGISNYYIENITDNETIILWSDLRIQDNYVISITDWNATLYSARVYTRAYTGLETEDTIKPFLLTTEESSSVKFVIQDEYRSNIPNVKIEVYKIISGEEQMVSSVISDATGTGLFWLRAGDQYGIKMYYNEILVYETGNYVVKSPTTYFYLNLQSMTVIDPEVDLIITTFKPLIDYLAPSVETLEFSIDGTNVTGYYIQSYYRLDNNAYAPRTYTYNGELITCNASCEGTVNISTLNLDANIFFLELIIVSSDINHSVTKRYYKPTSPAMNLFILFGNARLDFGCPTDPLVPCGLTMLTSIVLSIMIVGGLAFKFGIASPTGMIIIALAILGVMTLVSWFYLPLYILLVIVGVIAIGKGLVE